MGEKTSNSRSQQIEKMVDRKEGFIEKTLTEKEQSIRTSSSMRDAVLLVTTFGNRDLTEEGVKSEITKWRKWLYREFENVDPF